MAIELVCERGKAKLGRKGSQIIVLTGRRKRWDYLHHTWYGQDTIQLQGLYRGTYADAVVKASVLADALEQLGAVDSAASIRAALDQPAVELPPVPADATIDDAGNIFLAKARAVLARIPHCSAAGMAKQLGISMGHGAQLLELAKAS